MYDVVIIGGGAAGLMAAGVAARAGNKVVVIEKMEKTARKVRISGKGRCNVTNACHPDEFMEMIRVNREFFAPSFAALNNYSTKKFFRDQGVPLKKERGDRLFPESDSAWDIADALGDWAKDGGAEIMFKTRVVGIRTLGDRVAGVTIVTNRGFERTVDSTNVIIATGGVSYPATGSTGDGYDFAYDLGHEIAPIRPSLVPLESNSRFAMAMKGVELKNVLVTLLIDGESVAEEFGEMEFGTRGIEGPVILKLSRDAVDALIAEKKVKLKIDMKTALDEPTLIDRIEREVVELPENAKMSDLLRKLMPKPMIIAFAAELGVNANAPVGDLPMPMRKQIIDLLKGMKITITDYRPFTEAIITAGGVDVEQVDPETLQSKIVSGLYFAGEVLDLDANTGGYNLQIAFSTGWLAGQLKK